MRERIASLRDHFVICGFGRVGYEVAEEFNARSLPFVVVDNDPTALQWAQHRERIGSGVAGRTSQEHEPKRPAS